VNRSSDVLKAQIATTPKVVNRDDLLRIIRSYISSYDSDDPEQRIGLFADRFVFEDPAGVLRASGKPALRAFYTQLVADGIHLRFETQRVVVVGYSCLVEATAKVRVGDRQPALLNLFIVFRINEDGLIEEFRTYFDEDSVSDALD
jgi:limonene-1,2-epoxide hydrolase